MIFQDLRKLSKQQLATVWVAFSVLAFWIFTRVAEINPAILQDEFIYSYSSRRIGFWDQAPAYDFGNYLFNLIYSSTSVCGDAFYTCGKLLNLVFFSAFVFTLFLVALRYIPFWWALGLSVAIYLSPLSVYVSMYLPESLYFFLIALSLLLITYALESDSWRNWLIAGGFLGAAGLAKPHALISLMAVGLFILIYSIGKRPIVQPMFVRGLSFLGGYLSIRVVLGFLIAGPKSLNVFGAYGASTNVGDFVGSIATGSVGATDALVGAGSVEGALGLFSTQFEIHFVTLMALLASPIAAMSVAVIRVALRRSASSAESFTLLVLIWLGLMVVAIVLFTGWVTGGGDDHTDRVLLRYYEFLVPVAAIGGLVASHQRVLVESPIVPRLLAAALPFSVIGTAYGGFFAPLSIQIADAPSLAGFVGDAFSAEGTSVVGVAAIATLAVAPRFFKYVLGVAIAFTFVFTGNSIHSQYDNFRGGPSVADQAGLSMVELFSREEREELTVIAPSRFDGRVASLWMDSNNNLLIRQEFDDVNLAELPNDTSRALLIGTYQLVGRFEIIFEGDGFMLVSFSNP